MPPLSVSTLRFLALGITLLAVLSAPWARADAANPGEVAFSTLEMSPIGGKLFREVRRPVDWRVEVRITAPWPQFPKVRPVKRITAAFPGEMEFVPARGLPACPDPLLDASSGTLGIPVEEMIKKCPDSLIGNGRARLYLAKNNGPEGTNLNKSELVIFYGGRNPNGTPRLKVYGFDAEVSAGVYMEGRWENNVLDVGIPQLPFDTSTGFFELSIPGRNTGFPSRVGRDPGFVRASCPDGLWEGTSEFLLGERDSSGLPFGEDVVIRAPDFRSDCEGLPGTPSLKLESTLGSKSVGRLSRVRLVVRNPGTATARNVRIRVTGGAVARASAIPAIGKLAPGAARTVQSRVSFLRKGRTRVRFLASANGSGPVSLFRTVEVR